MKTKRMNDSEWKPITLEGTLLSNGIEGLIGIEELTDYSLEHIQNKDLQWQNRKKGKIITTEVKSAKKKKVSNLFHTYLLLLILTF